MAAARSLGSGWFGFIASTNGVTLPHIRSSRGSINTRSCSSSRRACFRRETRWRRPSVDNNNGSPWLSTTGLALSAAVDSSIDGSEQQSAVDELWWEEGAPVQSLEIACRCVCQWHCCCLCAPAVPLLVLCCIKSLQQYATE